MIREKGSEMAAEKQIPNNNAIALQAELEVLRDVYNNIRTEIRDAEAKIENNLNYALAGLGAIVVLIGFISDSQQYFILLLLPFVFYILAFNNYMQHLGIYDRAGYLIAKIYPRMREIIHELNEGLHEFGSFDVDWEIYKRDKHIPNLLYMPVSASAYGLQLLFSLFPIGVYLFFQQSSRFAIQTVDRVLLIVDALGFVLVVAYLVGFWVFASRRRRDRAKGSGE